jgi:hypothetical protein
MKQQLDTASPDQCIVDWQWMGKLGVSLGHSRFLRTGIPRQQGSKLSSSVGSETFTFNTAPTDRLALPPSFSLYRTTLDIGLLGFCICIRMPAIFDFH